jgi:hypothetical protein
VFNWPFVYLWSNFCLFRFFAHFKIGFCLLLLIFKSSLYILDTSPLSDTWFESIFFHSVVVFSSSWWCPLKQQSLLLLLIFVSVVGPCVFIVQTLNQEKLCLFSSRTFIGFAFTFRPWINFGLVLQNFILCIRISGFPSTTYWEDYFFLTEFCWHSYQQISWSSHFILWSSTSMKDHHCPHYGSTAVSFF